MNNFEKTLCEFIQPKVSNAGKPIDTSGWERGVTEFQVDGEWYVFAGMDRTGSLMAWKKKFYHGKRKSGNKWDIRIGSANLHDNYIKL